MINSFWFGSGGPTDTPLPAGVLAKTVSHYKIQPEYVTQDIADHASDIFDQVGANDLPGSNVGLVTRSPLVKKGGGDTTEGSGLANAQTPNRPFDFLHNGSSWFMAFVFEKDSTSPAWNVFTSDGNAANTVGLTVLAYFLDTFGLNIRISEESGGYANVISTSWSIPCDIVHAIIINYDSSLGSNNLSIYMDGSAATLTGGSRTPAGAFSVNPSDIEPRLFGGVDLGAGDFLGEQIIGDDALDSGEISDLFDYFDTRWAATFPVT